MHFAADKHDLFLCVVEICRISRSLAVARLVVDSCDLCIDTSCLCSVDLPIRQWMLQSIMGILIVSSDLHVTGAANVDARRHRRVGSLTILILRILIFLSAVIVVVYDHIVGSDDVVVRHIILVLKSRLGTTLVVRFGLLISFTLELVIHLLLCA